MYLLPPYRCLQTGSPSPSNGFLARKELAMTRMGFPRFKKAQPVALYPTAAVRQRLLSCMKTRSTSIVPEEVGTFPQDQVAPPDRGQAKNGTSGACVLMDIGMHSLSVRRSLKLSMLPSTCEHPDIGIDVGLKSFLTDSRRAIPLRTRASIAPRSVP